MPLAISENKRRSSQHNIEYMRAKNGSNYSIVHVRFSLPRGLANLYEFGITKCDYRLRQ